MLSVSELRVGMSIKREGKVCEVLDVWHTKPGKGVAYVGVKLKELKSGKVMEHLFRSGEKVEQAHIRRVTAKYLYKAGDVLHFMDNETFEELQLSDTEGVDLLLPEGEDATVLLCDEEVLGVELPPFVILQVEYTEPGVKGDTVGSATKPARLSTGLLLQVPLFIEVGDKIKVDTRTKEYVERVR